MKIGLVTPYIFPVPGGVNAHVGYLYENLVQRGHDVRIISSTHGPREQDSGGSGHQEFAAVHVQLKSRLRFDDSSAHQRAGQLASPPHKALNLNLTSRADSSVSSTACILGTSAATNVINPRIGAPIGKLDTHSRVIARRLT